MYKRQGTHRMNFEFMTIDTPLPPWMPFPRALTGFPVSSTAKVMYCRMLDLSLIHIYEKIDNMDQALERAVKNGVKNLVVQPTHLMHGAEYDELSEARCV